MASSLVISVKSARSQADLARYVKDTTSPRDAARVLHHFFQRIASGLDNASFDVTTSANAPVRASGTVTLTNGSIAGNDTVTVAGQAFTAKASGATGAQFNIGGSGTVTATNLAAAINAHATISKYVNAKATAAVVTVTANVPGAIGNLVTLATSNGTGFALSGAALASGAGGAETVAVSFSRGL